MPVTAYQQKKGSSVGAEGAAKKNAARERWEKSEGQIWQNRRTRIGAEGEEDGLLEPTEPKRPGARGPRQLTRKGKAGAAQRWVPGLTACTVRPPKEKKKRTAEQERIQEIRRVHARRYAKARSEARRLRREEEKRLTPADKKRIEDEKLSRKKASAVERTKRYKARLAARARGEEVADLPVGRRPKGVGGPASAPVVAAGTRPVGRAGSS